MGVPCRFKIKLIKQFLDLDSTLTVVISDIDTAWVQNPMPYFDRYPTADILTSTDELRPTVSVHGGARQAMRPCSSKILRQRKACDLDCTVCLPAHSGAIQLGRDLPEVGGRNAVILPSYRNTT